MGASSSKLEKEKKELEKQIQELNKKITQLEKENREFINKFLSVSKNKVQSEKDYNELKLDFEKKKNEINKLMEEKDKLQNKCKDSKGLKKLNDDLIKAQENLSAQVAQLEKEKNNFEKERENFLNNEKNLKETIKKLEQEKKDLLNDLMKKLQTLEQDKLNLLESKNTYKDKIIALEEERKVFEKEKSEANNQNEKIKVLEEKKKSLEEKNEEFSKIIMNLKIVIEMKTKNESNINIIFDRKAKFINNITDKSIFDSIQEKFKELLYNKTNNIMGKVESVLKKNPYFLSKIEQWKNDALDESIKNFINKTKHINIILLGKTGTGKSTLINELIGDYVARESGFRPETRENKNYETDILRLWDTEGIEANKEKDAQKIIDNAKKLIKDSERKGPDWFIHCIWYCVTGYRFEEIEDFAVRELTKSYVDEKLPLIIVYTHALSSEGVYNIEKGIKEKFSDRKIEFTSVLARDEKDKDTGEIIRQKFGLENLIKITMDKFKNSIDSMSYHFVLKNTNTTVKNRIKDIIDNKNLNYNNLNNSICQFYEKLLDKLDIQTAELIREGLENITNSCKNDIDFNDAISNHINECKKELFKDIDCNKEFKQGIIDSIEKEILFRYEKIKTKFIENELNKKIFVSYVSIIEKVSESIVTDSLKKLKKDLIPKMQKEIDNSPNFKSIYEKFKITLNNYNDSNENTSSKNGKPKLKPIKNKKK